MLKKIKNIKLSKKTKNILLIILLVIIISTITFIIGRQIGLNTDTSDVNKTIKNVSVKKRTIEKTLTSSGQIETSKTKKLKLNTSYYYDSMCVEEGDLVSKGDKILKYTNGTYLTAPYDLIISSINVPDSEENPTSSNYIEVKRTDNLIMNLSINESEINSIKLNDEVKITLTSDDEKTYTGKITSISNTGTYSSSGSTFSVKVSFTNDGNVLLGMSASCEITIETVENAISVPVEAITTSDDTKYVSLVENGKTKKTKVTTGISDGEYVQIKTGLNVGDKVQIITETKENNIRSSKSNSSGGFSGGTNEDMKNFSKDDMPSAPSGGTPPSMPGGN